MNKWGDPLKVILAVLVAAGVVVFAGTSASIADKGGCPNANSENADASEDSAHSDERQEERGCLGSTQTPTPSAETPTPTATASDTPTPTATETATPTPTETATPTPTATETTQPTPTGSPTPTPTLEADVEAIEVVVSSPVNAIVGVPFVVSADASVRNNGPVAPVVVDITFTPVLPAGCTATTGVVAVQNTTLTGNLISSIGVSWNVTCTAAGPQTFTVNASAAIDPLQPATDPNPANNSASGSSSTVVS
jgi:hypothetical protein